MNENDLKLDKTVFRFLFASPAHFVGECYGSGYYLTVAFPTCGQPNTFNPSTNCSTFIFSVRAEPMAKDSNRLEMYQWIGEEVSALLGAFYGKLIANLGYIQCGSIPTVPAAFSFVQDDQDGMPFNNQKRRPDAPELNLFVAECIIEKYIATGGDERLGWILRAAEFYRVALESFRTRPEIALAMLCSALEALLPLKTYSEEELCDNSLASMLKRIAEHCPKGDKIVHGLKSRLYQIKRKVAAFVNEYVPESYFHQRETDIQWAVAKDRNDLISRIRCTYDLRSKVLHTGDRRGLWYFARDQQRAEIGFGSPVLDDTQLQKVLAGALTLTGLERVVSTVLRAAIAKWTGTLTQHDELENGVDAPRGR